MKVVHFQRKPHKGAFSIERVFEDFRSVIPKDIDVKVSINRFFSMGLWKRVYDIMRAVNNQGDINHITGDIHYVSYLMSKKKTILTIHDCVTLEKLNGIRYWIFWFFWYWLPAQRCATITVISESTKKELLRHLRSDQYFIVVIPDCVSSEFKPVVKEFNNKKPRILQIGTKKNKNIERVAMALAGICCQLVIIGQLSQDQLSVLHKHNIDFENHVGISREALVNQYLQADLVMFASLYEGFGLPILEAQAIGRPVITSNLYSMPEVGGYGACYVNPYDVHEIRTAVIKIIDDTNYRQQIIKSGFQNVKMFHPAAIAKQYADLYYKVFNTL